MQPSGELREGGSVSGRLTIPVVGPGGLCTVDVTVRVGVQHYFETDALLLRSASAPGS